MVTVTLIFLLTKWSNTLKQFFGKMPTNCLSVFDHFLGLALKGLTWIGFWHYFFYCNHPGWIFSICNFYLGAIQLLRSHWRGEEGLGKSKQSQTEVEGMSGENIRQGEFPPLRTCTTERDGKSKKAILCERNKWMAVTECTEFRCALFHASYS